MITDDYRSFLKKTGVSALLPATFFGVFFGSSDLGMYRSLDGANSWSRRVAISRQSSIAKTSVISVAFDPKISRIIYLGSRGEGLYKSVDGGEHWYKVRDANHSLTDKANIYQIAIDQNDGANIYLAAYQNKLGRVFRSRDGGNSFDQIYEVSVERYAIFTIKIDPNNSSIIYVGTAQGGLIRSRDYGNTWEVLDWLEEPIAGIEIDTGNSRILYAATFSGGIYKSLDYGQSWDLLPIDRKKFPGAYNLEQFIIDPNDSDIFYIASTSGGLMRSMDAGSNWENVGMIIPDGSRPVSSIAVSPTDIRKIYVGVDGTLYKSDDFGRTWSTDRLALKGHIKAITINVNNPKAIFVGIHK